MVRTSLLFVSLAGALLLSVGCKSDKDAREYAEKLIEVLRVYQQQVNEKVKAEQDTYEQLALIYAQAERVRVVESLTAERLERSGRLADEWWLGETPVTTSAVNDALNDYAAYDLEVSRDTLLRELDAHRNYLEGIEALEVEMKRIQSLTKALQELAKPKSREDQVKELAQFAEDVNKAYQQIVCAELEKELETLNSSKTGAEAEEVERLDRQLEEIQQRIDAKKCSELNAETENEGDDDTNDGSSSANW